MVLVVWRVGGSFPTNRRSCGQLFGLMGPVGFRPLVLLLCCPPDGLPACRPLLADDWGGERDFLWGAACDGVLMSIAVWVLFFVCLRRPLPGEGKRSALDRESRVPFRSRSSAGAMRGPLDRWLLSYMRQHPQRGRTATPQIAKGIVPVAARDPPGLPAEFNSCFRSCIITTLSAIRAAINNP